MAFCKMLDCLEILVGASRARRVIGSAGKHAIDELRLPFRIPAGYNQGMNLREISPVARLIAGAVSYVAIVVLAIWMLGGEAWRLFTVVAIVLAGVTSPFAGAGVVWLIVRHTNSRGSPNCRSQNEQERIVAKPQ